MKLFSQGAKSINNLWKLSNSRAVLLVIVSIALSLALYLEVFSYYFFQDDFNEIILSRAQNFQQFLHLFRFIDERAGYRPLGLQIYFSMSHSLFGLNPLAFKMVAYLFLLGSYYLIVTLVTKIAGNRYVGFLTGTFWLLSSIHFMPLAWAAGAWLLIGTFFFLLAARFFLEYIESNKTKYYVLSFSAFILTAGSFEFFISWPIIFGFYHYFILKNKILKSLKLFTPFILTTLIYVFIRRFIVSLPSISEYNLALNLESLRVLFWYLLWTFNVPEEFKKQALTHLLVFNKTFLLEFWQLVIKTFLSTAIVFTFTIIVPLVYVFKKKISVNYKIIILSLVWFLASILPMLLLPNHTFSMYLTLPAIGVYFLISYLLISLKKQYLILTILIIWLFSSYTTISFYKDSSYIVRSQQVARDFEASIKNQFSSLPKGSVVFYPESDSRTIQALFDQRAIQVIYNDPTLRIYYNREKFDQDLKEGKLDRTKVYVYEK